MDDALSLYQRAVELCPNHASYYANNLVRDTQSDRLHALVDHWLQVNGLHGSELAARIHADSIQILVDLSGHMGDNRLPAFAYHRRTQVSGDP